METCENCRNSMVDDDGNISCDTGKDYVEFGGYCDDYAEEPRNYE